MVFSNVSLSSPGLGVESEGRKEEEGLRAWAENNSVSVFSYTKCIILSSNSRLTAWIEKQHLKVAAAECQILLVQIYVKYTNVL